jgi:hypothetical protein
MLCFVPQVGLGLAAAATAVAVALGPPALPAQAVTNEQLLFLEAWRAVDRAYVDKSFNGQSWFKVILNTLFSWAVNQWSWLKLASRCPPALRTPCDLHDQSSNITYSSCKLSSSGASSMGSAGSTPACASWHAYTHTSHCRITPERHTSCLAGLCSFSWLIGSDAVPAAA